MPALTRSSLVILLALLPAALGADAPAPPADAKADAPAAPAAREAPVSVRGKIVKPSPVANVPPEKRKAWVLVCDGVVDPGLHEWLVKTTNQAIAQGATHIIYEIDTYGGLVKSAIEISEFIAKQVNPRVHTTAYIPDKAISAGIMISLACRDIFVGPNAKIGDSAPVAGGGEKIDGVEREKIESMLRAAFRSMAQANGYPEVLCEAMVTGGPPVYRVLHKPTGRYEYLRESELTGKDATHDLAGKRLVIREKQLLTMTAEEAFNYGFAESVLPVPISGDLEELRTKWEQTDDKEKRAELRAKLAERLRSEVPAKVKPILVHYGVPGEPSIEIAPEREDFLSAMMAKQLNTPMAVGLMLALGTIGLLIGLKTGEVQMLLVGLVSFATFFFVKHAAGTAEPWEIALTVAGVLMMVLEVLYMPTMGGLLLAGAAMFLGGIGLCFLPPLDLGGIFPSTGAASGAGEAGAAGAFPWDALQEAAATMMAGISAALVGTYVLLKYLHRIPFLSRTVLAISETESAGAGAAAPMSDAVKVGEVGIAETALRPVGKARFGDRLLDVVADGEMLPRGDKVEVIACDGNRIRVRKVN